MRHRIIRLSLHTLRGKIQASKASSPSLRIPLNTDPSTSLHIGLVLLRYLSYDSLLCVRHVSIMDHRPPWIHQSQARSSSPQSYYGSTVSNHKQKHRHREDRVRRKRDEYDRMLEAKHWKRKKGGKWWSFHYYCLWLWICVCLLCDRHSRIMSALAILAGK